MNNEKIRTSTLETPSNVTRNSFSDLKYIGVKPDSVGVNQHWYNINGHEVPVDAIEELECEEVDESDTI